MPAPMAYVPPMVPAPSAGAVQKNLAAFPRQWDRQFFAQVNWHGHRLSMIGRIKGTSARAMRITCASEFGTLLCDLRATENGVKILHRASGFPAHLARLIGVNIARALRLPAIVGAGAVQYICKPHQLMLVRGQYNYLFAGRAGKLRVCRSSGGSREIEIQYGKYGPSVFPGQLIIWNDRDCLLLTLNFKGL